MEQIIMDACLNWVTPCVCWGELWWVKYCSDSTFCNLLKLIIRTYFDFYKYCSL